MKRYGALVILVLAGLLIGAKKPNFAKFTPPTESHGLALIGYGCDRQYVQDLPSNVKTIAQWNLIVWAEYGDHHKRYWSKTYGTYQIAAKEAISSTESAAGVGASGNVIGMEAYDFGPMDKACVEWKKEMESTFKMRANGSAIKQ